MSRPRSWISCSFNKLETTGDTVFASNQAVARLLPLAQPGENITTDGLVGPGLLVLRRLICYNRRTIRRRPGRRVNCWLQRIVSNRSGRRGCPANIVIPLYRHFKSLQAPRAYKSTSRPFSVTLELLLFSVARATLQPGTRRCVR